jgi:hypothetical protein
MLVLRLCQRRLTYLQLQLLDGLLYGDLLQQAVLLQLARHQLRLLLLLLLLLLSLLSLPPLLCVDMPVCLYDACGNIPVDSFKLGRCQGPTPRQQHLRFIPAS